jgi:hypothetical protein
MSAISRFHIKQPTGWFAAGREVELALTLLSDATFKLFVWLCLHAERSSGIICASPATLAIALDKAECDIKVALEELLRQSVCKINSAGEIEIADRFWPYQRTRRSNTCADLETYIAQVKKSFLERRCVRSAFTSADEKLATQLHQSGVTLVEVQRAILLGSLRKYAALINNRRGTPITSLHYFTGLVDETRREVSTDYWSYVAQKITALEQSWNGSFDPPELETK